MVAGQNSRLKAELHQHPEELLSFGIKNARASAAHHVRCARLGRNLIMLAV